MLSFSFGMGISLLFLMKDMTLKDEPVILYVLIVVLTCFKTKQSLFVSTFGSVVAYGVLVRLSAVAFVSKS